ncbi:MAG: methyltransferase [Pseudomonadota bacterium]
MTPRAPDESPLTFEKLQELIDSHYRFQLLNAAVKFDLFTLLRNPLSEEAIAKALGVAPQPVAILLEGCVALGLIERREGLYRASSVAALALAAESPFDQRPLVRFADEVTYPAARHLHEALRDHRNAGVDCFPGEGETLYSRLPEHPDAAHAFDAMMRTVTGHVTGRLLREIAFPDGGRLLDVAGGGCDLAIALAQRWPSLAVTVLDLPWVVTEAEVRLRAAGMDHCVRLIGGDAFAGAFPASDHIIFAHFLEIWSEARGRELLRVARRALAPHGRIYLVNMVQPDAGDVGFGAVAASLYFQAIASGEGRVRRWCDYESWLEDAGFVPERRVALTPMHGLIVARSKA